ncbi:FRG domain-containing protein [Aliarcobacter butzleri]
MANYKAYEEKHCQTASELWNLLSPTNELFKQPNKLIFRGQADSNWGLIPSILRKSKNNQLMKTLKSDSTADFQVFNELIILNKFVEYCDNLAIKIPNDSINFRKNNLDTNNLDKYINNPSLWLNEGLFELVAMAQHHGVPTRLLDWTESSYIALYFAVSSAFERYIDLLEKHKDIKNERIAIWILNLEFHSLYNLKVLKVPRSSTINLSAQKGLFTVHPHNGSRNGEFLIEGLEKIFTLLPETPLIKITLPISEIIEAHDLCEKIGINSTTLFPNAQGIEKGIKDTLNKWYLMNNLLR